MKENGGGELWHKAFGGNGFHKEGRGGLLVAVAVVGCCWCCWLLLPTALSFNMAQEATLDHSLC
jgi:hypothetical protein